MALTNPVTARLLSGQLVSPMFYLPEEVVSWFGAIQAQDQRSMRWAVAMRTRKPSVKAFEESFNDGKIIRAHLLRCTWQLVAAEDYHWLRQLIYPKALSVMNGWTSSLGFKFDTHERNKALSIIEKVVGERGVATEADIRSALIEGGIPTDHLRYNHHLRMAEIEGLICSGPIAAKNTYMLTAERIGDSSLLDKDEALWKLANKYFRSHTPATLEDFEWWSGLSRIDCKKAIGLIDKQLDAFSLNGKTFYIHTESPSGRRNKGHVHLLPSYDEYLIGFKSREVVLDPEDAFHAHDKRGIFQHVVALDGRIVGNWHPSAKDCNIRVFKEGITLPEKGLEEAIKRFRKAHQ